MHIPEPTIVLLRPYIVDKLSTVSEADNDVLADYILELLKSDGDEATVRSNAKEQLGEFLEGGGGDALVDDIFRALGDGTFKSRGGKRQPDPASTAYGYGGGQVVGNGSNGMSHASKKRGFEADGGDAVLRGTGERPVKTARRGGGRHAGVGSAMRGQAADFHPLYHGPQMQGMPGFDFDPSDPFSAFRALQQAMMSAGGGDMFPGLGQMAKGQQPQRRRRTGKRCRDYDNKGVCTRGAACPYDHGNDFQEYNPTDGQNGADSDRGRSRGGRGRSARGTQRGARGGRAEFSHVGRLHDPNATGIVVENIPQDSFTEDAVRTFFSEFGSVEEIMLQDYRHVAIVRFADHDSAERAYESPKVVFDNRFVKVYWYKSSDSLPAPRAVARDGSDRDEDVSISDRLDPAAFAAQQAAAQERFETLQAAKTARMELEDRIRTQNEERTALLQKLADKTGVQANGHALTGKGIKGDGNESANGSANDHAGSTSETAALRAKLAALEAEARSIGLDPDSTDRSGEYIPRGGRGRGGFRGRGRGRGRGAAVWRGGGGQNGGVVGAVKRLDNRPRIVSVVFNEAKSMGEAEEGLKQFLLFNNHIQASKVSAHPSPPGDNVALLVGFTERYRAESFIAAVDGARGTLPHVGKVEVAWVPNGDVPAAAFPEIGDGAAASGDREAGGDVLGHWDGDGAAVTSGAGDAQSDGIDANQSMDEEQEAEITVDKGREAGSIADMDYDVADDDARWDVA